MPSPLVKSHLPICSTTRAKELGFDLNEVATCGPPNVTLPDGRKSRGCPLWEQCRFDRDEYGGFKGTGPKMVGVYARDIEGSARREHVACFTFVSAFQSRMDFGRQMRDAGAKVFEFIRIIGQEGDPIKVKRSYPVVVGGKREWKDETKEIPIPAFPDPLVGDPFLEYERELMEEEEGVMTKQNTRPAMEPSNTPLAEPVAKPRPGQTR